MKEQNPQRDLAISCLVTSGVLIAFWLVPTLFGLELGVAAIMVWALASAAFFAFFFYLAMGRSAQRAAREMQQGISWARWTYGPAEWKYVNDAQWERAKRTLGRNLTLIIGAICVTTPLLCGAAPASRGALFFLGLFLLVYSPIVILINFRQARKQYLKRQEASPGEVIIGPAGILQPWGYTAWVGLHDVTINHIRHAEMVFSFRIRTFNRRHYQTRSFEVQVPIPKGEEEAAEHLARRILAQKP